MQQMLDGSAWWELVASVWSDIINIMGDDAGLAAMWLKEQCVYLADLIRERVARRLDIDKAIINIIAEDYLLWG